jgi:hypothetical protein
MKRRVSSESSKTSYYDDVFTNIDLYKNIIKQCGEYYTQLNTIYNMCLVCKAFSLSRNDTIMLCGDLGLFEKSDKSKIFPILIETLNCNQDNIVGYAYNKINFFFYPYSDNSVRNKSYSGVPLLILGGFPSTYYMRLKSSDRLKINFDEYIRTCDHDLCLISHDLNELEEFSKNIESIKFTHSTETIDNILPKDKGTDEKYFRNQNYRYKLDYPGHLLLKLHKIRKITMAHCGDKKGSGPVSKERHLLDIKTIYCKREFKTLQEKLMLIFSSYDLTCSCFAFFRIGGEEYSIPPNFNVEVYSTPYNLYSILSKKYKFTNIIENPVEERIYKYQQRGWIYEKHIPLDFSCDDKPKEPRKKEKIYCFQKRNIDNNYWITKGGATYLENIIHIKLFDEYEKAIYSVLLKLNNSKCGLSKYELLLQFEYIPKEEKIATDYIIIFGMDKILLDLLNRKYISYFPTL